MMFKTLAAAILLASPLCAMDFESMKKQGEGAMQDPTVKAVADKAGAVAAEKAGEKAGEELTNKLKNVQNENGPIVFKNGKADVDSAKCEKTLKAIDGIVKQFPGFLVTVEGHTDNKGAKKKNQVLSQKRAESVINWLAKNLQTPAKQLTAKGYGDSKPIADNKTEAGRAKNRRVDFSVTKQ
jgi:outer membrane protein OmpA-like peptidoglycan-associated protein